VPIPPDQRHRSELGNGYFDPSKNRGKSVIDLTESRDMRSQIVQLEAEMKANTALAIHIEPKHYFAPGIYMREMTMPEKSAVVGKIHKTKHLCILAKGSVSVANEDGVNRYTAPSVIPSMPGTKRALYAHEESVWINVHHNPTNENDIEKIDDLFVVETFDQFLAFAEQKRIEGGT
jgi:hypothetical protein